MEGGLPWGPEVSWVRSLLDIPQRDRSRLRRADMRCGRKLPLALQG